MKLQGTIPDSVIEPAAEAYRKTKASYKITGDTAETLKISAKVTSFVTALEEAFDSCGITCWVEKHPDLKGGFTRQMDPVPIPEGGTGHGMNGKFSWSMVSHVDTQYPWKSNLFFTDTLKYPKIPYHLFPVRIRFSSQDNMVEGMYMLEKNAERMGMSLLSAGSEDGSTMDAALAIWYLDFPTMAKANEDYMYQLKVLGFMDKLDKID